LLPLVTAFSLLAISTPVFAATTTTRDIFFPTQKTVTFYDDFGEPRAGHLHIGIDMLGAKLMPEYAAVDGVVSYLTIPEASWGYELSIRDSDGYTYDYLHINNDTPGTDDDLGGPEHAFAPGIERGSHVTKGEFVAWMGDSGDAEDTSPHLHFEIHTPDGTAIDPYPSLIAALYPGTYSAADAEKASPDINTDKELLATPGVTPPCVSGTLIKSKTSSSVYYCGADGKRYVFPSDKIYFTWYANFNTVTTVTDAALAAVPLGGNVTYRPGIKMVKITSTPQVYAVEKGGNLRWIQSPAIATSIYGASWAKNVDDISDAFFGDYKIGEPITAIRQ
ncbi:MAG: M23 family metallopeptidase, partial [Patescibacteria group bacterium]